MAVKDLQKILKQVHEPNEFTLVPQDLSHRNYWIWKAENCKLKDLNENLREFRKEHARFDIFINGQYILERDYITEQFGRDFYVKFIRNNFSFNLQSSDDIKIEGDIERI